MSKIRVGIIGCGAMPCAHIPAYLKCEDAEIVYFCDIIKERAEECVEKYGVGQAVTDYKVIAQDETIDAVSVCTPNNMHSIISIDMLRAGSMCFAKSLQQNLCGSFGNAKGAARDQQGP